MINRSAGPEIIRLIDLLAKLPGLGPRSARRAALHLMKKRDQLLNPLAAALADAAAKVEVCRQCGNFDTVNPCAVCAAARRRQRRGSRQRPPSSGRWRRGTLPRRRPCGPFIS